MIGVAEVLGTTTGAELEGVGMADGLLELGDKVAEGCRDDAAGEETCEDGVTTSAGECDDVPPSDVPDSWAPVVIA